MLDVGCPPARLPAHRLVRLRTFWSIVGSSIDRGRFPRSLAREEEFRKEMNFGYSIMRWREGEGNGKEIEQRDGNRVAEAGR